MPDHIGGSNKMVYAPPYGAKRLQNRWAVTLKGQPISEHPDQASAEYWRNRLNAAWASGVEFGQAQDCCDNK